MPERFLFIHVMKTAGTTLRQHIRANFAEDEVYPAPGLDPDLRRANFRLDYLTDLPPERRERIRVFAGHFPFLAAELLGGEMRTLTVLRDPVERTLSLLRALRRRRPAHRGRRLEEVYEDPFVFPGLIHNHQAKLFALTLEDRPTSYMDELEIDAKRLELARANLERVDVVGTQERFDDLLAELERRFGWDVGSQIEDRKVSARMPVSRAFRHRIAADNAADVELYQHARRLGERRGREPARSLYPRPPR